MSQAGGIGGGVSFPITPAQGGTGLTSYTTGDMIYASATNTLARLPIASLPGSFLAYDGVTPEWYSISNQWLVQDDFLSDNIGSQLGWGQVNGGGASITLAPGTATAAHPGVRALNTTGAFGSSDMHLGPQYTCGGGRTIIQWIAKTDLSGAADRFFVSLGLGDTTNDTSATNGVYFFYQDNVNSGNWRAVCVSGGVATNLNSSIAADTSFHRFLIDINAAGTSVSFSIDGVSLGAAITTNIPTTTLMYFQARNVNQGASTGATKALSIDTFMAYQKLTTAR